MARPTRCRRICGFPDYWSFGPEDDPSENSNISNISTEKQSDDSAVPVSAGDMAAVGDPASADTSDSANQAEFSPPVPPPLRMTLDEFETIRLIDYQGMTQEQCARQMDVSRTTVTSIYTQARQKLARCLVEGMRLVITGGHYRMNPSSLHIPQQLKTKGGNTMRIAVTYENGEVFQHFGHTQEFKVYDIEDGRITKAEVISTGGTGHGALAGLLHEIQADALICGGIGGGARNALAEAGIDLYPGVTGPADAAAHALAEGRLDYDPDTECDHHGHGHGHGEGHACGHGHGEGDGHACGHGHGEGHGGCHGGHNCH